MGGVVGVESFHSSKIAVVLEERMYQSQCLRTLSAVTPLGRAVSAGGRRANQKLQTSPRPQRTLVQSSTHVLVIGMKIFNVVCIRCSGQDEKNETM